MSVVEPKQIWWTAEELANSGLPELPGSKRGVNSLAERFGWRAIKGCAKRKVGRGGGWIYHWSVLPLAARRKLLVDASETPDERPDRGCAWAAFDSLPETAKTKAKTRLAALQMVDGLHQSGVTHVHAVAEAARQCGSSARSIYNWIGMIEGVAPEDRLAYLVPRNRLAQRTPIKATCNRAFMDYLKSQYLQLEQPTYAQCYRDACAKAKHEGWDAPTNKTARRRLDAEVPRVTQVFAREGETGLMRCFPAQIRDRSTLTALEGVNADCHKIDVFVRWPDGTINRPQIVAFQDLYSGKMLSWRVDNDPNKVMVMAAFGELVENYGIPRHCLFDNGREFANKWITGGTPTRFRFKVRDDDPLGVLPLMEIKIHWATPAHGQAKPIERGFRDFASSIAKDPRFKGAYTGNRPDAKPENYGSRAVPLDTFLKVVAEGIAEHNARQGRLSATARGRSFDETFAESYASAPIRKATEDQRRLWLMGQEVGKLNKNSGQFQLYGNFYHSNWMSELRAVLTDMTALAKMDAYKTIDQTSASVRNLVLDLAFWDERSSASAAQDFLGLRSIRKDARAAGAEFARNLDILESSKDPALKLRAALNVRDMLMEASGGLEGMNAAQREFYEGLAAVIRDMELLNGKVVDHEEQQARAQRAKTEAAYAYYAQTRTASDEQRRLGQEMLAQLQSEVTLQQAIAVHGEGSVAVAEQRLSAERAVYQKQTEARDIASALKAELMAAWDAANNVASVDMAGNISLAADEAHRLLQNLIEARGQEIMSRVRQNPDFNDPRGESPGAGNPDYVYQDQNLPGVDLPSNPRNKRGGGAKQIEAERRAIERLIERERERLEVLRETDPVLKEMARIRDILKNATDAEREAVEAMIRERLKEQGIIEQTSLATDFLETNVETLAEGMAAGGERAAQAWDQVKEAILAAALQAALLGEGPWADLFGLGGGTGGVTGIILGGLGLADGGTVYGAGGNKDDKVPAWLSPGETVVTAKATRQYRPLLQAMNDGVEIPGLADGGTLAPQAATQSYSGTSATGQPPVLLRILPSPLFKVMVDENATGIAVEVIEDYDRNVAPDTIKRTINDPRRAGG